MERDVDGVGRGVELPNMRSEHPAEYIVDKAQ